MHANDVEPGFLGDRMRDEIERVRDYGQVTLRAVRADDLEETLVVVRHALHHGREALDRMKQLRIVRRETILLVGNRLDERDSRPPDEIREGCARSDRHVVAAAHELAAETDERKRVPGGSDRRQQHSHGSFLSLDARQVRRPRDRKTR